MESINYLKFGLLAAICFGTLQCSAIQCHHCKSFDLIECRDPFESSSLNDTSTLVDCNTLKDGRNYTFCRKTVQIATLRPDKETTRVIRSCGFMDDPKLALDEGDDPAALKCFRRTGTYGVELMFCACYADGCNSSSVISTSMGLVFLFALLSCKLSNSFLL